MINIVKTMDARIPFKKISRHTLIDGPAIVSIDGSNKPTFVK